MSTEHQQYSTENQMDTMGRYADGRKMQIVRTYSDEARSGLNIEGRNGLRDLIRDVETGRADYTDVLVYDVSRWGRFQDVDESAYYEYICKRANVRVHYCAEQFENDGSLSSTLLKTIKRTMAGEYSRELSVKVFAGQCRLIEHGFRQGGPAGYGLRRQLVDRDRNPKEILARGVHKSIQTDRVILVPGPEAELQVVRQIYDRFTQGPSTEREIAAWLNERGLVPKYGGANVYNRRSFKLKRKRVVNPPEMWIRCDDAFTPIVPVEQFKQALAIIENRHTHLTDEQLLERLRSLLARIGEVSGVTIDEAEDMPSSAVYQRRFGGLARAYAMIGYTPLRDLRYIEINRAMREYHKDQCSRIMEELKNQGAELCEGKNGLVEVNQEFTASVVISRCRETLTGRHRWLIRLENTLDPDITIAARLTPTNQNILDYYIFPKIETLTAQLRLAGENGIRLDSYRFDNLDFFLSMARRTSIEEIP
jgi:DNA invertase Pin-like site-specific DNA recombinase